MSLHIPKTAGTSFRKALDAEYGGDLGVIYDGTVVDARRFRAVHGHFHASELRRVARRAKWIMWLREPVDRLVSYYDFWSQSERHGNPNHDHFLESGMSLEDFVEWEPIRSEFARQYVANLEPDDFFFVGITERYEGDLARLAQLLGWRTEGLATRTNVAPTKISSVDDDLRRHIEEIHAVEFSWYRHFSQASP